MGSREGLSAVDTYMVTLTPAQERLHHNPTTNKKARGPYPHRPTFMANDMQVAFNWVMYHRILEVLTKEKLPVGLVRAIDSFTTGRTISMNIDGQTEMPAAFTAGLPQDSPLSPDLFIPYASTRSAAHLTRLQTEMAYVDDEPIGQGSNHPLRAISSLTTRLQAKIARAEFMKITFALPKVKSST